ncbi:DUF2798 domain-containing protein [Aestuariibacter sp. GS-14]|uniref:DUF2798 domain-containing protein n=1 Tax=Aestuariibacter sp. GS-14 TaxID=2590670 RepID=UPI001126303E|nr:DUF2798 domain-containing protein [Aestuariibacter sp. GS-14]TPV62160.1 DUF2798 domain-containing protein [Aestuariibacter sp. GS-14]
MINSRYAQLTFSFFMALFMSGIMSLAVLLVNVGANTETLTRWLTTWPMTFTIAFPTILLVSPVVKRLVDILIFTQPKAEIESE